MKNYQLLACGLVVIGVLSLAYGGFTYTKGTHDTTIGPLSLSVADKERVNIPVWAGIGSIVVGGLLFFSTRLPRRR